MLVSELMKAIYDNSEEAHDAALVLGLLIERERVNRPNIDDDGGIKEIIGDELAKQRFSDADIKTALAELTKYINETSDPHPMAVWALTKSYDQSVVPDLINLLKRVVNNPHQENLAYQALLGLINIGIPSDNYRDSSIAMLYEAAEQGHGRVMETAVRYLETHTKIGSAE